MTRTEKLEKLLYALAAGETIQAAARAAEFSERTVYRRLEDPHFKAMINQIRAAALSRATARLLLGMKDASEVLKQLLKDENPAIRQRAATKLIELGAKLNIVNEIERRIEQLERYIGLQALDSAKE